MSWNANAIGRPLAVAAKLEADLAMYQCAEPEETVKKAALAVMKAALEAQDPVSVVKVAAHGSQGETYGPDGKARGIHNTLSLSIEPVHGFIE